MPQGPGKSRRSLLFVPQGQQAREVQGFRAHMTNSVYYGAITEDQTLTEGPSQGVNHRRSRRHGESTISPEIAPQHTAPDELKLSWEGDPRSDIFLRANFQSQDQSSGKKASITHKAEEEHTQETSSSASAHQHSENADQVLAPSPSGAYDQLPADIDDDARQLLQSFVSSYQPQPFVSSSWQRQAAVPVVLAHSPALYWGLAMMAIAQKTDVDSVFTYRSRIISELQRSIDDPSSRYGDSVLTGIACLISIQSVQEDSSEENLSNRGDDEEVASWEQCIPHAQAFWTVLRDRKNHAGSPSDPVIAPFVNYLMIFAARGFTCHVRANESDRVLWQPKLTLTTQRLRKLQDLATALADGSSEVRTLLQDADKNVEERKSSKEFLTMACGNTTDQFYQIFNLCYLSVALIMSVSDGNNKEKTASFYILVASLTSKFQDPHNSRRLPCELAWIIMSTAQDFGNRLPGAEDYVSVCITMLHATALLSATGMSEVLRFLRELVSSAIDSGPIAELSENVFAELDSLMIMDDPEAANIEE
ncbi:hypothetical protein H2198_000608 [Neophaeococcomyces mojaviensis]|uniref:Uncharacterized protein n=1 Tax=Neophaeococcomyces mojaviensis TaxID=3383035 RepID=A0ACC3AJF0_9EURO|nr:hypothetical protein H2198_000608 [Knufia sp. JES_112]